MHEPQTVSTGKLKQDIVLTDGTGMYTLTLWEAYINTLQLGKSYQFSHLTVKIFMGKHHLSTPITGCTVEDISDIENLDSSDTEISEDEELPLLQVKIIGVQQLHVCFASSLSFAC